MVTARVLPWATFTVGLVIAAVAFVFIRGSNLNSLQDSIRQDCETQHHAIVSAFNNAFSYVGAAVDLVESTHGETRLTPQLLNRFTQGLRLNAQLSSWLMVLWLPYVTNTSRPAFEAQARLDMNDSTWQIVTWNRVPRAWDAPAYMPYAYHALTGPVPPYLYTLAKIINGFDVGITGVDHWIRQGRNASFGTSRGESPNYHAMKGSALVSMLTAVFTSNPLPDDLPSGFLGVLNHYLDMTTLCTNAVASTGVDSSQIKVEVWDPQADPTVGQWLYNGSSPGSLDRGLAIELDVHLAIQRTYRLRCTPTDAYVISETITVPVVAICFISLVSLMVLLLWRRYFVISDLLKQVAEINRQKSQFLSFVCHELRNPLHAITGMNSLMLNTDLNRDQKGFALSIDRSAQLMCAIVNDVLDMSKIEAGKLEFDNVPFSLRALVKDIEEVYRLIIDKTDLRWEVEVLENVPQIVSGDPVRIRQMLINLVSNAFKFTDAGCVKLTVQRARTERHLVWISFRVSDTGPGISPENLPKLFKAFSQTQGTTGEGFSGTGLGLSIVKSLAETMGGEVSVSSEVNRGSTFSFDIPLKWGDATAAPTAISNAGRGGGFRSNWKAEVYHSVVHHWEENDAVADEMQGLAQGPAPPLGQSQGKDTKELRLDVIPKRKLKRLPATVDPVITIDEDGGVLATHSRRLKGGAERKSNSTSPSPNEERPLMLGEGLNSGSNRRGSRSKSPSHSSNSSSADSIRSRSSRSSEDEKREREFIAVELTDLEKKRDASNARASPPSSEKEPSRRSKRATSTALLASNLQTGPSIFPLAVSPVLPVSSRLSDSLAGTSTTSPAPYPVVRILLVDDGAIQRRLVGHILRKPGIVLTTAVDGIDGVTKVEQALTAGAGQMFDVIYMDVQMPRMDGLEATRRIRALGVQTPVVALTGNAMASDRADCMSAGMSDVLTKPFSAQDLIDNVVHWLTKDSGDRAEYWARLWKTVS